MAFVIGELIGAGLVHPDTTTVAGAGGLRPYGRQPALEADGTLVWRDGPGTSADLSILAPASAPFSADGGLKLLTGNLGRAVIKTSAVKPEHRVVHAPAIVFENQESVIAAFDRGELQRDFIAVVRFQGPRANGMPELHKLTPLLGVLQDQGHRVALVTDGRMSGASGKVPAAIHVTPECLADGPLARVQSGDMILLDAHQGVLEVQVDAAEWEARVPGTADLGDYHHGMGRELFAAFRANALGAESGAVTFHAAEPHGTGAPAQAEPIHDHFVFATEAAR